MDETVEAVTSTTTQKTLTPTQAERAAVRELVKAARARGDDLTGPDGLLKSFTKDVPGDRVGGRS
jgi:hypothetical protein